jgi:hypothetical protein
MGLGPTQKKDVLMALVCLLGGVDSTHAVILVMVGNRPQRLRALLAIMEIVEASRCSRQVASWVRRGPYVPRPVHCERLAHLVAYGRQSEPHDRQLGRPRLLRYTCARGDAQ